MRSFRGCLAVVCFLSCISVALNQPEEGVWGNFKNALNTGKDTLTGYFSSSGDAQVSCSQDDEACVLEETDDPGGGGGIKDDRVPASASRKDMMRSNPFSYYWSQFSQGAGKIYQGVKDQVSTSVGEIYDSVQSAIRFVVYDEMGRLFDLVMPSMSTPATILLTSVNVLPEQAQTLLLVVVSLVLVVVLVRFVSLWFAVGIAMATFLCFRMVGPYRTIELGVRAVENAVRSVGYLVHYPRLSALLILLLVLGSLLYPLYSWWCSYQDHRRLLEMHELQVDTHARVVRLEEQLQRVETLLAALNNNNAQHD